MNKRRPIAVAWEIDWLPEGYILTSTWDDGDVRAVRIMDTPGEALDRLLSHDRQYRIWVTPVPQARMEVE